MKRELSRKDMVNASFLLVILIVFVFLMIYQTGYQSGKDKALNENAIEQAARTAPMSFQ